MSANLRIRFRCQSCTKPLSIGRKKAGQSVTCPSCKKKITVPTPEDEQEPEEADDPFSEFEVYDDDFDEPELVYSESETKSTELKLNSRLSISRRMVYIQGLMLGLVAITFFLLGLIIGNSTSGPNGQGGSSDSNFSGTVLWRDGAVSTPDEGAVVFLLPVGKRPDSRFESEELIPGRVFTSSNPEVKLIRDLGGNVCTTNRAGYFEMKVPSNQEYVLLVVSANGQRSGNIDSSVHEEVGQYFSSVQMLVEDRICYVKRVKPLSRLERFGDIQLEPAS